MLRCSGCGAAVCLRADASRAQLAGILALVNERFSALEATVAQQRLVIQELEYHVQARGTRSSLHCLRCLCSSAACAAEASARPQALCCPG